MEISNYSFLDGISFVLGIRKKHPWGEALGFKNSRITSIFKGLPPTADALEVIALAENVNINWLLSGEGYPFYTHEWYTDQQALELYRSPEKEQFILTDGTGRATLMCRSKEKYLYGDAEANFDKYYIVPNVNLDVLLSKSPEYGDVLLASVDNNFLNEVNLGEQGPHFITYYLAINEESGKNERVARDAIGIISARVYRTDISRHDEERLLNSFRILDRHQRNAVLTIIESISNPHNVDVNQLPPYGIFDPDSDTKGQAVSVHEELPPSYKIHSDDES